MSKEQLMERILSSEGKIESTKIRRGDLHTPRDTQKLLTAVREVRAISDYLLVDDTPSISLAELSSRCRRARVEHGLDIVIIDYLQLMMGSKEARKQGREREVSEISMGLKALAKELSIPVIAAAQLNRSPDSRPDKRPKISDLRESGSMEQDADLVMFIYRDEYYNPQSDAHGKAEVILGKNRHGPLKTVDLAYVPQFVSFRNLAFTIEQSAELVPEMMASSMAKESKADSAGGQSSGARADSREDSREDRKGASSRGGGHPHKGEPKGLSSQKDASGAEFDPYDDPYLLF